MIPFGLLILGIALLYIGGENLVRSSVVLADRFGVSELVIGLTVVAFGTSSPELFVSVLAIFQGRGAVSLGNVLGSNTINIAVILGFSALVAAIPLPQGIRRREVPFILLSYCAAALLLPAAAAGVGTTRLVGLFLVALLIGYVLYQYRLGNQGGESLTAEAQAIAVSESRAEAKTDQKILKPLVVAAVAVAALAGGGHLLVENSSYFAREVFGVSERFIGITIVAIGTSAPELATSIVAAARGRPSVVLGAIIGSNVFNTLLVLGVAALSGGFGVLESGFGIDFAIMVSVTLLLWGYSWRGELPRLGGVSFLACYAMYVVFLLQTSGT